MANDCRSELTGDRPRSILSSLTSWKLAPVPAGLRISASAGGNSYLCKAIEAKLKASASPHKKAALERVVMGWLFSTVKSNVKRQRGRFMLEDALKGEANCLGYARLFQSLAPKLGLDCGIVDVVIDNAGRHVPHQANLFRFADGTWQIADAWYGSTDIKHRRLGVRIKEGDRWRTRDVDIAELKRDVQIAGLRKQEVNAITLYILGNRHLARSEAKRAVDCYSAAIHRYPNDSRPRFNRAIAWEQLGETEKAHADYAVALRDDSSLIRLQTTEHDEVTNLIGLDSQSISQLDQAIYLMRQGFIAGKPLSEGEIARRTGVTIREVEAALARVGTPQAD